MRLRRLIACTVWLSSSLSTQEPTHEFRNRNGTFHIDLPATWRQVAPNEARVIGENPRAPARLVLAQPHHFYPVGPVDQWLAGRFDGPWVYIVEQDQEWYVADTFAEDLAAMWAAEGQASGERHDLSRIERTKVGVQQVDVVMARRLNTPTGQRPVIASLDVHAPTGGRQVTLSFCCPPEQFEALEPTFRSWLATLTFARIPRDQASLGDRLWTPMITGGIVGLVLLLLYKHTRSRR